MSIVFTLPFVCTLVIYRVIYALYQNATTVSVLLRCFEYWEAICCVKYCALIVCKATALTTVLVFLLLHTVYHAYDFVFVHLCHCASVLRQQTVSCFPALGTVVSWHVNLAVLYSCHNADMK